MHTLLLPNMPHPPRQIITIKTTTMMADGQGKRGEIRKRRGEATKTIGMAMKPAAAARPTAPAARADEAERRTSPTEMESHTVGPMGRIAIMTVWYAPIATPTTTLMPHGTFVGSARGGGGNSRVDAGLAGIACVMV